MVCIYTNSGVDSQISFYSSHNTVESVLWINWKGEAPFRCIQKTGE